MCVFCGTVVGCGMPCSNARGNDGKCRAVAALRVSQLSCYFFSTRIDSLACLDQPGLIFLCLINDTTTAEPGCGRETMSAMWAATRRLCSLALIAAVFRGLRADANGQERTLYAGEGPWEKSGEWRRW